MRPLLIFACLFTLVLCTPKEGDKQIIASGKTVDPNFKLQFDNCIQIITLRQVDCKKVDCASDYWDAVFAFQCLHAITKVESNIIVNSEDPYFYPTTETKDFTEFFYEDLIRWNDWFEQNKFTMTMAKADSLLKIHSDKVGYEVRWPQAYTQIFSSNPLPPQAQPIGGVKEEKSK